MEIKILGTGCKKCETLESNAKEAVKELGMEASFEKVTDFKAIASYGVLKTPGLVINGKAVSSGKVLSSEEIQKHLSK